MSDIVKILPYTVDLDQTIEKTELHTLFVMGDDQAHRFEVTIMNCGAPVDLTDCTVKALFTNFQENSTIEVVGNAENSKAIVTLKKSCYKLHGQFVLTIQIKSGDVENSIFLGVGYMRANKAEKIIYDDYVVYDVDTLLAQIAEMKTATTNANKAADAANAAAENAPYINASNNNWMAWDAKTGKYADTGVTASGPRGADGTDGQTPRIGSNGNWWIGNTDTGTSAQGPKGADGTMTFEDLTDEQRESLRGPAGKDGQDGHTPVKGTDYWTADDKAGIVSDVLAALPNASGVNF